MTGPVLDEVLDVASEAIGVRAGLRTSPATEARLESSVLHRARALGLPVGVYAERLRLDPAETQELIDGLTVQETSFFRDPQHLDALTRHVVRHDGGPVVVWSAGCATGPEPYSIVMALDEVGITDVRVIATDLSRPAVRRTEEALYRESELRGLSAARRGRYLRREGTAWRVDPAIRERVSVRHHNLLDDPIPLGRLEATAVFCRNVFLYLRRDRIDGFLDRLRAHLAPGGVLFLGGSETLWTVPTGWRLEHVGGAFAYRVDDGAARSAPTTSRRSAPATVRSEPAVAPVPPRPPAPVRAPDDRPVPDHDTDVRRHRRAVYLAPDDALAHLQLGLSLEAAGDARAGHRAFRAARAALDRADVDALEARLEGYGVDALRVMIDAKLSREGTCR